MNDLAIGCRGFESWRRLVRLVKQNSLDALDQIEVALKLAEGPVRARLYAVSATAFKQLGDLDAAEGALRTAKDLALEHGDTWCLGDVAHRGSYVELDRGDTEGALKSARAAAGLFSALEDWGSFGRTLLTQGVLEQHNGATLATSARLFKHALKHLTAAESIHRTAALMNLARLEAERADFGASARWLRLAQDSEPAEDMVARFQQIRGRILILAGRHLDAIEELRASSAHFLRNSMPIECADSTIWLCEALLETGQATEATKTALEGARLLGHLKGNRAAAAIVAQLASDAAAGRLLYETDLRALSRALEEAAPQASRAPHWASR